MQNYVVKQEDSAGRSVVLHSGTFDECKDWLVTHYGDMPMPSFLDLKIGIHADI